MIERSDSDEVVEGDIVLFSRDRRLFAHRFVRRVDVAGHEILTRGDAMPAADATVRRQEMLGKIVLISRNGKHIKPRKRMHLTEWAVAACVQRSEIAARLVVKVHSLRQTSPV